ncbi:glycosyltransferase family 2 protein [Streptomyces sp. NPDC101118]|uniref:glycosyltransferase family 2 protein n=1 Tax=Streptomyces sp. NPDC101118 TaxID=3366109 RepID=UPI00381A056F
MNRTVTPQDQPDVSVVIDAANALPGLADCLTSVLAQAEEGFRVEVLAFDRGSQDGSRELLQQWAAQYPGFLRFAALPPSETPAEARNTGIEQATGRHLLFLSGTDRLTPGALRRMVTTADQNEADIVLGKVAGLDGQKVGTSMFARNAADADVFASRVYWSLSPDKLFRRSLVERCFLRFPADWRLGEEVAFTALAYLYADRVSVVADTVCVQQARRVAGVNASRFGGSLADRMAITRQLVQMVAERVPPGPGRDHVMARHFELELGKATGAPYRASKDTELRWQVMSECRELLEAYGTPGVFAKLPRPLSVRLELIRRGRFAEAERLVAYELDKEKPEQTIEDGRVFRTYPYFRDPDVGVPDDRYEVTHTLRARHQLTKVTWTDATLQLLGTAYIEQLPTRDPNTRVVLRERRTGAELRFRTFAFDSPKLKAASPKIERGLASWEARIDLSAADGHRPITGGLWDVFLSVSFQGVAKEVRLGSSRGEAVTDRTRQGVVVGPVDAMGLEPVCHLYATKAGNLTLEVSDRRPLPGA